MTLPEKTVLAKRTHLKLKDEKDKCECLPEKRFRSRPRARRWQTSMGGRLSLGDSRADAARDGVDGMEQLCKVRCHGPVFGPDGLDHALALCIRTAEPIYPPGCAVREPPHAMDRNSHEMQNRSSILDAARYRAFVLGPRLFLGRRPTGARRWK